MWGWSQSSSSSNVTPGFQAPNQFSSSTYPVAHHAQTPPIHSSQASVAPFQLLGSYPEYDHGQQQQTGSTYSLSSSSSTSTPQIQTPWNMDILGSSPHLSTHKPAQISPNPAPSIHMMAPPPPPPIVVAPTTTATAPLPRSGQVGETTIGTATLGTATLGADHHDHSGSFHKVASGLSRSPFSMDFILQKSVPADSTPGVGYVQQSSVPTNSQFVDQPTRYSEVPYQVAPPSTLPPLSGSFESNLGAPPDMSILHRSQPFDASTQHVNQIGIGSHTSGTFSDEQQYCSPDKLEPFQVCPSDFNPSQPGVLPGGGGSSVESLPPSEAEAPYSPPELVLEEDNLDKEEEEEEENGRGAAAVRTPPNTVMSAAYKEVRHSSERDLDLHSSNLPQLSTHVRPASFGIDDDDDDDDDEESPAAGDGNFLSRGFQLGVSPSPPSAPRPPPQPAKEQTPESSLPSSSANEEEKKRDSTSSDSSSSSSSESSSNSEDNATDTAEQAPVPQQQQWESCYQEESKSRGVCDPPGDATIPLPPPLVPTHTLPKSDGNEYEGDNDDVFLPSSPCHPSSLPEMKSSSAMATPEGPPIPPPDSSSRRKNGKGSSEKSLALNEGERKTTSLIVGKRGRAAGKILDEEKLRVPLVNGWQRIVRTRLGEDNGPTRVDICYVTPCKRRLRTFPEIQRYMDHNGISNLTIANFSFSKKVNVGVIINEETIMDGTNEELARPRRGRPPKHLKTIKGHGKSKEGAATVEHTGKKAARISLEPHEIGLNMNKPQQVSPMVVQKEQTLVGSGGSPGNTHLPGTREDGSNSIKFAESQIHQLPMVTGTPPPLVRTGEQNAVGGPTTNGLPGEEKKKRGWKRKSTLEGWNVPVVKKPRGRPKGSVNKTSGPRKPRIPRNIKYIPPPQLPLPSNLSPSPQTQPIVNGDTSGMHRKEDNGAGNTDMVKKHLEDREKRRRLLLKAREGGTRRKNMSNPLQRSHRKLAQQARRERERMAKQKQNAVLRQKEVELEEIRKSRIARQRENEYRQQALERTQNLMEQLKKQEEERERMMYLRKLELEKAEQLRKPTEDLLVKNLTTLPTLSKIELVSLSSEAFLDLVTIFQFVQSFEDFLELDRLPGFIELYCGLFNVKLEEEEESEMVEECVVFPDALLLVLIQMFKAAIHDPGTKTQTMSGCSLREIEVKEHTVSELVRLFLSKVDDGDIQKICNQLQHLPFSSLSPSDKTRVLAFLVEELLSSSSLCREIDNRMEQICSLRRIKWKISLKLKRFRSHFNVTFGAEIPVKPVLYSGRGRPPKKATVSLQVSNIANDGDSSDEEADGGAGGVEEDAANLDDDESDYTDEDSDEEPPDEREDLHKRIKEMKKKIVSIRGRINASSKQMRIFPLGQDRYSRQYWSLPEMGGVMVEGIETSTFDPLEKYIAEITYRREVEEERKMNGNKRERKTELDNGESNELIAMPESRATSEVPISLHSSPRINQSNVSSDPPSIQLSDSESDSHVVVMATIDTPIPEFTPNSTPPPPTDSLESSPEKSFRSTLSHHPLEIQQLANNGSERNVNNSFGKPSSVAAMERDTDSETTLQEEATKQSKESILVGQSSSSQSYSLVEPSSGSGHNNALSSWFSLLPRKQCEVLHYLQMDASQQQQQQQQQGVMMMPQFLGGSGYAYVTPEGAILSQPVVQQVQMGYALVGNTLVPVPQTQYVMGQNTVGMGGANGQLVSLGNGQYALAPGAGNVQYVSINGNQYAILQAGATDQQENTPEATNAKNSSATPELQPRSSDPVSTSLKQGKERKADNGEELMQTSSSSASVSQNAVKNSTPTPPQVEEPQQLLTLAIPGANGGEETQYVQVPADPRVLSGECSYAVVPQADGSTQIVLIEKSALGDAQTLSQGDENVKLECPHAVVMDNEYESGPWTIDITLMYADAPLPFVNDGRGVQEKKDVKETEIEKEEKLSQLLEQVDKGLTHGWWSITSPLEMDYLIRCLTMRGYREKNLYKLLNKNKDVICNSMNEFKIKLSDSLAHRLKSLVEKEDHDSKSETNSNLTKDTQKNDTDEENEEEEGSGSQLEKGQAEENDSQERESDMEVDITEVQNQGGHDGRGSPETDGGTPLASSSGKMLVIPSDGAVVWDPYFPDKVRACTMSILDYLCGMETRLFDAHLPIEGSQKVPEEEMDQEVSGANLLFNISDGLLRLERCVQRRYLKRPFKDKHSEAKKENPDGSTSPVEEPAALVRWRSAVSNATSSSQLGVCMNQLERCIAWEKSPMKVFCVVCRTGDNESLLLLCDKCDRGTHTYCCKPKLENIPEGNWYCHDCFINASRKSVCNVCETARGILLHCTECPTVIHKRCHNPPLTRVPSGPWQCSACRRQNRRTKPNQHAKDELVMCYDLLKELEELDDSWPFLIPVDKKKVPSYYKVIKKAMDFSTVKSKLLDGKYSSKESFAADIRLVFDNCSFYNEDDSEIGMSGHKMRQYFEKKWTEIEW